MAKIDQKNIKIFAENATDAIAKFGTFKAGSPTYSIDPAVIQGFTGATGHTGLTGKNAWSEGWYAGVTSNNAPCFQDMNALFYVMSRYCAYRNQVGIQRYDPTIDYVAGSIVTDDNGYVFRSNSSSNLNNGLTGITGNYWQPIFSNKVQSIGAGTNYQCVNDDRVILWDAATTGSYYTVTLPPVSSGGYITGQLTREIIVVVLGSTEAHAVDVVAREGGTIASINQYGWQRFINTAYEWEPFLS